MREIKFRAWDKRENKMVYNAERTYDHGCGNSGCMCESFGEVIDDDNYDLMQFTGQRDMDGKEIYESDIIQIVHPFQGRTYFGKIIFKDAGFAAENFYFPHYDNPSDVWEGKEYIRVIGNTYENPELM